MEGILEVELEFRNLSDYDLYGSNVCLAAQEYGVNILKIDMGLTDSGNLRLRFPFNEENDELREKLMGLPGVVGCSLN